MSSYIFWFSCENRGFANDLASYKNRKSCQNNILNTIWSNSKAVFALALVKSLAIRCICTYWGTVGCQQNCELNSSVPISWQYRFVVFMASFPIIWIVFELLGIFSKFAFLLACTILVCHAKCQPTKFLRRFLEISGNILEKL